MVFVELLSPLFEVPYLIELAVAAFVVAAIVYSLLEALVEGVWHRSDGQTGVDIWSVPSYESRRTFAEHYTDSGDRGGDGDCGGGGGE